MFVLYVTVESMGMRMTRPRAHSVHLAFRCQLLIGLMHG